MPLGNVCYQKSRLPDELWTGWNERKSPTVIDVSSRFWVTNGSDPIRSDLELGASNTLDAPAESPKQRRGCSMQEAFGSEPAGFKMPHLINRVLYLSCSLSLSVPLIGI